MKLAATLLFGASIAGTSTMLVIDGHWYYLFLLWAAASLFLAIAHHVGSIAD